MTTEKAQLPAPADLTPPATLLQQTEQTLMAATTEFFTLVEQQADATIAKYADVVWQHLETVKGMDAACKARQELRQLRTGIVDKGHAAIKAPLLAVGRLADARKDELGKKLKAAEALIDGPIKAEEARKAAEKAEKERLERERIAAIRENIHGIAMMPSTLATKTSAQMREVLAEMTNPAECPEEFAELIEEASNAYLAATNAISRLIADAEAREAEQARLKAERERLAEEERKAAEARRQQQAELDRLAADLEEQRAALAAEQERARQQENTTTILDDGVFVHKVGQAEPSKLDMPDGVEWPDFKPAATTDQGEEDTSPLPAERTYKRPSDEELIMAVAERFLVPEHIAYEWLAGFGAQKKAA